MVKNCPSHPLIGRPRETLAASTPGNDSTAETKCSQNCARTCGSLYRSPESRYTQRQDIHRIEAQVYAAQPRESPHHKSGPNQEHHGECNFRDHQSTAKAAASGTLQRAATGFFEGFCDIRASALKRGRQTKEESGRYHCDQGESENPHVRRPGSQARGGLHQEWRS